MKSCPSCQTAVADNATACPKCGHSFASNAMLIVGGVLGFILISLVLVAYLFGGP